MGRRDEEITRDWRAGSFLVAGVERTEKKKVFVEAGNGDDVHVKRHRIVAMDIARDLIREPAFDDILTDPLCMNECLLCALLVFAFLVLSVSFF